MKAPRPVHAIPAVEKVVQAIGPHELPRPIIVQLVRQHLAGLRSSGSVPDFAEIVNALRATLTTLRRQRLQPVINGTGIVLHTNFGRAPLGAAAVRAVSEIASSYNNLEYDIESGGRGKRGAFLENGLALLCGSETATLVNNCAAAVRAVSEIASSYNNLEYDIDSGGRGERGAFLENGLALLCGTEAATLVNNCAAALVLIVKHFTKKKPEVVISRGELVQIGGGFRIGEMLAASGARLREVGATNKTNLDDYANAIGRETALVLKVHQSNFFMSGFADVPPNDVIARLAHSRRVPFVADLGSGAMAATESLGISEHEPTPAETLADGADLVCFSGDKLFGGPQAGVIAGKSRFVSALKREPIFRALRCDKMVFAAMEATVDLHLRKETALVPALALLAVPNDKLRARGEALVERLRELPLAAHLVESRAEIGGGALPRSVIPSCALEFSSGFQPNDFAARLRSGTPPIVGYVANGKFKLDLRTIFPEQDDLVVAALKTCLTNKPT